jgi:hypothetical protein
MLDPPTLCVVLTDLLRIAESAVDRVEYRLVGTAASLLHGVRLPAGDVDILLKERAGVDAFSAALHACRCLTPPRYLEGSRQYFASFDMEGIAVEFSTVEWETASDIRECTGTGPWIHYRMATVDRYRVPVVAPELRLITELTRRRPDRYRPILSFLRERGCDVGLLRRAIEERVFDDPERRELERFLQEGGSALLPPARG